MVTIKGTKEGINVVLGDETTVEEAKEELIQKFEEAKAFFKGDKVYIHLSSNTLSEFELFLLQGTIEETLSESEVIFEVKPLSDKVKAAAEEKAKKEAELYGTDEGMTRFYQGTVRSGQLVDARGNLVVIGDANPGSELVAGGNVIVMGAARGMVHAGAGGNRGAVVVALNLMPTQIRIADIISRCPDGEVARADWIPEIAYIKDDAVYIEQYLTKKS